ncbi:MAG: hypothetical protein ACKO0Y_04855, partial [Bacteroidota bacterium]
MHANIVIFLKRTIALHQTFVLSMPTALFIDSMGLVFRAYHAMSKSGFKAPNGEPTGAVFGFANMIT